MAEIRESLLHPTDSAAKRQILTMFKVKLMLGYASAVLEQSLCKGMIFALYSLIFPLPDRDIERARTYTPGTALLLVGGWAVHG